MTEKILAALKQLDTNNDAHWTEDGLPRLETVKLLASDQSLTRSFVTMALPGFSRTTVVAAPIVPTPIVPSLENSDAKAPSNDVAGDTPAQSQPETEGARLAAELEAARGRMVEASAAKAKADQVYAQAVAEVDSVIVRIEKNTSQGNTFAAQLSDYQKRQAEIREERARRMSELKASGFKLSDILPSKAPIDSAFARKTARGGQRPTQL